MPVENSSNYRNNVYIPIQRTSQNGEALLNTSIPVANIEPQQVDSQYYHQFGINPNNFSISSEKVDINDESTMREIYEIDREAFANQDPYDDFDDFKQFILREHLSTYAVKDGNGTLLGYYQLEPVKNGDMYIDSMGLKPEYRNSRKGYNAIKQSWKKIQEQARANGAETMSLHVDATNPRLVKIYKTLGFEIQETLNNYYENGANAYFMTRPVDNATIEELQPEQSSEQQLEQPQTTSEVQVQQTNPEQTEFASTKQKLQQIEDEFVAMGKSRFSAHINANECARVINCQKIFDEKLYSLAKELVKIDNQYGSHEYNGTLNLSDVLECLQEKDENDNIRYRKDVIPYIETLAQKGVLLGEINSILRASKYKGSINSQALEFACQIAPTVESNDINDIIYACCVPDAKRSRIKGRFDKNAANFYQSYLLNNSSMSSYDVKRLLNASFINGNDGEKVFDDYLALKIRNYIINNNKDPLFSYSYYIEEIAETGCPLDVYFKYFDRINDNQNLEHIGSYNKKTAALIKAATYSEDGPITAANSRWNPKVIQDFINVRRSGIFEQTEEEKNSYYGKDGTAVEIRIADILNSCKETPYMVDRYNPQLLDKAISFRKMGFKSREIPALMELCKVKTCGSGGKCFDNTIFEKIIEMNSTDLNKVTQIIDSSKETKYGVEKFNLETYNILKELNPSGTHDEDSWVIFKKEDSYGSIKFDMETFNLYRNMASDIDVSKISDCANKDGERVYSPNINAIKAYGKLKDLNFDYASAERNPVSKGQANSNLLELCFDQSNPYPVKNFNNNVFYKIYDLLQQGYDGADVYNLICSCRVYELDNKIINKFMEDQYKVAEKLLQSGYDIKSADKIASLSSPQYIDSKNRYDRCIELYDKGLRGIEIRNAISNTQDMLNDYIIDDVAYKRLLIAIDRGFLVNIINSCKDNMKFSDRLFRNALDLQDKDYNPEDIVKIMDICHEKFDDINDVKGSRIPFSYEMFNRVADLDNMGVKRENIPYVLQECKIQGKFQPKMYNKVSELRNKEFDDKGVIKFLKSCKDYDEFNVERYNHLLELSERHKKLRDASHNDAYVLDKLLTYESSIKTTKELFGDDVLTYATNFKIDGYVNFAKNCANLSSETSEDFKKELVTRLNTLTSPEQKVKRLRVLGGLAGQVSQESMLPLLKMIKSPKMSEAQINLANEIFTQQDENGDVDYPAQIERFISEINVPKQHQNTVREYLRKARIDKQINRPKPIEEQKAQMEIFAQQMLTNANIPLSKKIKYIDEYKAKQADMEANPEKYTTPTIKEKPLAGLRKLVEAYVNIPNADIKFNNAVVNAMYDNIGIEPTLDLLSTVHYDAKYFDKMFAMKSTTKENFKRLISLIQMNPNEKLMDIRNILPEENSNKYAQYNKIGLIDQIKANQDTIRQFKEHNLDFDKWNSFNPEFVGETFSVEADPESEYKNLKYNIINLFNSISSVGDTQINQDQVDKLNEHLRKLGYVVFNNNIFKNGQEVKNTDLEGFTNAVINYISKNDYWEKAAEIGNSNDTNVAQQNNRESQGVNLLEEEAIAANAFSDHIKGFRKKLEDTRNQRTVNDIQFRLSDENDVGRNIFFGNHVGCCNSIESDYAGYSAPMHLLNNYNRGIELVDKYGNSYGNSLCYFADVDGELAFVIDSFEANGKLGSDPIVTKHLIDFGKQVCKEMGREDAKVMLGKNYTHLSLDGLKSSGKHQLKVLGTVSEMTYCDCVGGRVKDVINKESPSISMYETV